jgi:hypothetical protein
MSDILVNVMAPESAFGFDCGVPRIFKGTFRVQKNIVEI